MRGFLILGVLISISLCLDELIRIKIKKAPGASRVRRNSAIERWRDDCDPHFDTDFNPRFEASTGGPVEEPLKNHNLFWSGNVSVGNPKQNFFINLDTGSDMFWLACDCKKGKGNTCARHTNIFNCGASTTCKPTKEHFCVAYADGSGADGYWFHDQVCLDSLCTGSEPWIGCARATNRLTSEWATGDGLIGMAYDSGKMGFSPLHDLLENPACDQQIFAFYLDTKHGSENSELTICGTDPKHYQGDLTWLDVSKEYMWTVKVTGFEINGKQYQPTAATYDIDSGYAKMGVPGDLVKEIYGIDCDLAKLPTITITFEGGHKFQVKPEAYVLQTHQGCLLGLDPDYTSLGDTFLKSVYTAFHVKNGRIGLAQNRALHP